METDVPSYSRYFESEKNFTWSSLGVTEKIIRALEESGMEKPTPIQIATIPSALKEKKDILGAASTGSGKTLAFGIPIVQAIEESNHCKIKKKLKSLIITPTRELAQQIKRHLDVITRYTSVTVGVIFGGLSTLKQERILNKLEPDIIVATPGRLWELINELDCKHISHKNISNVRYLVIDEADKLTEKGHFEELKNLLGLIQELSTRTNRQTFVFSATLTFVYQPHVRSKKAKTKIIQQNPKKKLRNLAKTLGMKKDIKIVDLTQSGIGTPGEDQLSLYKIECLHSQKDLYLYYFLISNPGKTLIFCNSKDCLRRLSNILQILNICPVTLHAGMDQKKRLHNLERFDANTRSVLIASDVASRGLDIAKIDNVIHYQVPRTAETYIHRSGRTARCFNKGLSLILCCSEEQFLYRKLCSAINQNKMKCYPIDQILLNKIKVRVELALKIEKIKHTLNKKKANNDFFTRMAKECDIDIEDRDDLIIKHDNTQERKQLKILEDQLKKMLKKNIKLNNPI